MIHLIMKTATPLLLAGMGGLVTELAGTLNIGLEGLILIGSFSAVLGASMTGSYFVGVLFAVVAAVALSLLFVFFSHRLAANPFIVGLAINLLALGLTAVFSTVFFATQGVILTGIPDGLASYHVPGIDRIPFLGSVVSGHTLFTPVAWLLVVMVGFVATKTRFGLELRATGIMPEAVSARGVDPGRYRAAAVLFSGATCGLAGAALSLSLGAFVPNMSAGRGWIALVMVFLGGRRVWGVAIAALFFAAAEYGANAVQGSLGLPRTIALSIPYALSLISMIAFALVARSQVGSRAR